MNCYKENSPQSIYYLSLYNVFNNFLEELNADVLPKERTGFKNSVIWNKLYDFQKDAVKGIINKLETFNGCILADSVGLGKTFTALAVIKYYELRNDRVLVLCPKKLENNWKTYTSNYTNNILVNDRFNYDVLFHTDLNREKGESSGIDLERVNWGNYDLVVIDESHNFRNGTKNAKGKSQDEGKLNRYEILMKKVMQSGVQTKVLMLSATPVNNRFIDLRNQLALAYEGKSEMITKKMNLRKDIDYVFKDAQAAFNEWSKIDPRVRTTKTLLDRLSMDFFTILDNVTIARSRKHIVNYYDSTKVGKFPERLKPLSYNPDLTDIDGLISFKEIGDVLNKLSLCVYIPTHYVLPQKLEKYEKLYDTVISKSVVLSQKNRELGTRHLMAITLLKRLESSVFSFNITLSKIILKIENAIFKVQNYIETKDGTIDDDISYYVNTNIYDFDDDDVDDDIFQIGGKIVINISDMDYKKWLEGLKADLEVLKPLKDKIEAITVEHDKKFNNLKELIINKINNPINDNNKKVLIFTAFSDTADYLYDNLSNALKKQFNIDIGEITGKGGKATCGKNVSKPNEVMMAFSPISKEREMINPNDNRSIEILIGTDCISEGQNLQDCDYMINYDIHWNPVRIIQRFGRIDRIGSLNGKIQLVNFWPPVSLDEYLDLKGRVESRMKIVVIGGAGVGEDNIIDPEEGKDLQFRKKQLENLKNEVVDMEDMTDGISITDLGLNDFRMDLIEYAEKHKELKKMPLGLNAIVKSDHYAKTGVIYILKNINNAINIDNQNLLHPYYIVYMALDGSVIYNHLHPKQTLDILKYSCRSIEEPMKDLCELINTETKDGKDMSLYSDLLSKAVNSIIEKKDEGSIIDFLNGSNVDFKKRKIEGIGDFELVSFIIVR